MSVADKIREMAELRDQGLISEDEFQAEKAKLLSSGNPSAQQSGAPQSVNVNVNAIVDDPNVSDKEWTVALLLCVFTSWVGLAGIHRFYTGHIGIGLVQLFTFGGCGIWTLIDLILIAVGSYTDAYGRPLKR